MPSNRNKAVSLVAVAIFLFSFLLVWMTLRGENERLSSHFAAPAITCTKGQVNDTNSSFTALAKASSSKTASPVSPAVNYHLHPTRFVNIFTDCINNDDCRIYYFHFGKTGGTGIEQRMFEMFPPRLVSCCNEEFLESFINTTHNEYCTAKFSSYQVSGKDFLQTILPTCMTNSTDTRAVILVTIREPIQRTLSYIHQHCNKYIEKRPPQEQVACKRCSYKKDATFWNQLLVNATLKYQELADVARTTWINADTLTIDLMDLSQLYQDLYEHTNHSSFKVKKHTNPEQTSSCNFGFKSEMVRGLQVASSIYRNLTVGF